MSSSRQKITRGGATTITRPYIPVPGITTTHTCPKQCPIYAQSCPTRRTSTAAPLDPIFGGSTNTLVFRLQNATKVAATFSGSSYPPRVSCEVEPPAAGSSHNPVAQAPTSCR